MLRIWLVIGLGALFFGGLIGLHILPSDSAEPTTTEAQTEISAENPTTSQEISPTPAPPAPTKPVAPNEKNAVNPPAAPAITPKTAPKIKNNENTAPEKISAYLYEWSLNLSTREIPAGKVEFRVLNSGRFSHRFIIEGIADFGVVPAGAERVFSTTLSAGEYTLNAGGKSATEKRMSNTLTVVPR